MVKMSIFSLANFLILMAVDEAYQTLQDKCPPGWMAWQDACYILLPDKMNWWQARKVCGRPGSRLFVPDSEEKQEFICEKISSANSCSELWIGCEDAYKDGSLSCFGWGEDVNSCPHMGLKDNGIWFWGNGKCSDFYYAACEMRVYRRSYCLQADANGRFKPKCLLKHEIKNLTASGVIECGQACWAEPRCRSFNLWQKGDNKKVCQLTNATRIEADAADLQYVENCSFFEL